MQAKVVDSFKTPTINGNNVATINDLNDYKQRFQASLDAYALKSRLKDCVSTNTFSDDATTSNRKFYHASQMNVFASSCNKRYTAKTELEEVNSELKTIIQSLIDRITKLENRILSE